MRQRTYHWMDRIVRLAVLGALILALTPHIAHGQAPWQAAYWNNATLDGAPVLTRQDAAIDFNWGTGAPADVVTRDNFSARWSQTVTLDEGEYRFTVSADDGVRVWLNGVRIIDSWVQAGLRTLSANVYVETGSYEIVVEYFEAGGIAAVDFSRILVRAPTETATETPAAPTPTRVVNGGSGEEPASDTTGWRAEYYDNPYLDGVPDLVRRDNNIDFRWDTGSPAPGIIAPDTFSARWTRTLDLAPGRYRFAVTADDGVRLYIDNRLVIDQWHEQPPTTYTAEVQIGRRPVDVRVDYFENLDRATMRFSYARILSTPTPAPAPIDVTTNWRGEYFDNVNLSGPPVFTEIDPTINFDWGRGSPAPERLGVDRFSVRWTGALDLPPGPYRFVATADDGVRLRINGETVIDEFLVQSAQSYAVTRTVPGGRTDVVMEYFENTGEAVARLTWSRVD